MTGALTVSVVIVSRHRPRALRRCLLGLSQLRYPAFEVIVVADPEALAGLRALPQAARVRQIVYDQPNISVARNLGIAEAAGEVIAFIDDDSVPEPTWLNYLAAAFADPEVAAAGGWVRGRNGISYQSESAEVDALGVERPLSVDPGRITVMTAQPGRAIKTEGTNMAVRRSMLVRLGGFDPRYRFFLDETDLNLRLAEAGAATALVPLAQVHHGFAASARRRPDRAPRDLTEIGASWAVFLARHAPPGAIAARWRAIRAAERRRVIDHMVAGRLEPRDVRRLLAELEAGYAEGLARPSQPMPLPAPAAGFHPFSVRPAGRSLLIAGRSWTRRRLQAAAREAVAAGNAVTVMRFSPTALYHRVRFTEAGIWEQTGGLFGRSRRDQPLIRLWRFGRRVRAEAERCQKTRGFDASVT